jgi:hypothetical protein
MAKAKAAWHGNEMASKSMKAIEENGVSAK